MKTEFILIYVTFRSKESALLLAKQCLKSKLIVCANLLPESTSLYLWKGKVEQQQETIAILKTIKAKQGSVEKH